jgi:hypothetical protein
MSKSAEQMIIQSILDEFAESHQSRGELEAKALFRLLNYCPADSEPRAGSRDSRADQAGSRK